MRRRRFTEMREKGFAAFAGSLRELAAACGSQVRVMYTPFIGDEKRDIVEYTSLGTHSCASR
jgi:hypothetical protein